MITFITGNAKILAASAVLIVLAFLLGQCDGRSTERAKNDARIAAANLAAEQAARVADATAAQARVTDAVAIAETQRSLTDAIKALPDTAPDAVRIGLNCSRLRLAGRDTTTIAACAGHSGTN